MYLQRCNVPVGELPFLASACSLTNLCLLLVLKFERGPRSGMPQISKTSFHILAFARSSSSVFPSRSFPFVYRDQYTTGGMRPCVGFGSFLDAANNIKKKRDDKEEVVVE